MVGYMSLEEQVDADFTRARRKALLRRIGDRLRRNNAASEGLLCFEEVRKILGVVGGVHRGRRTVPSGQIAGSVGRCSDFDRAFLPAKASVEARWKRVDRAFYLGEELPPVSLYEIGGSYFALDGNHRVSVARFHGVEWIDADVTEFRVPSPVEPTRPRIVEETKEQMMPNEPSEVGDPKMHEMVYPRARIEVRWGLHEDEARIAELMELNGMRRALAFEERFIVAERDGKILAALRYRTEPKRLLLGLLVSDPWAEERPLAGALYARAGELAREMGVGEVRARPVLHNDDYPYEAGYRWQYPGGWYLDTTRPLYRRKELPSGGWRRMVALLGVPATPFFSAFRGAGRRMGRDDRGRMTKSHARLPKDRRGRNTPMDYPREGPEMREWMDDLQIWKQRREEMMREAEQNRLATALRESRKRRGAEGRASSLAWELERIAGRLLKLLRSLKRAGQ